MSTRYVIDVGCARHGGDYSVERLIEAYRPELLIGYDPVPNLTDALPPDDYEYPGTHISLHQVAAWTFDGEIMFSGSGLVAHVGSPASQQERGTQRMVPCVDLARVIDELDVGPLILKLDCEGGEFDLLEHLMARAADLRCDRILVEWHGNAKNGPRRRRFIEQNLACTLEQWRW